jgi:hypothetical protein
VESSPEIEEVTVLARRVVENVQVVPVAATVDGMLRFYECAAA